MKQSFRLPLLLAVAGFNLLPLSGRADDGPNLATPGFSAGTDNYYLFVAGDSKSANARFTLSKDAAHSETQGALLQADDFARCSIGLKVPIHPLAAGDRYRVGVWIKAGPGYQAMPGTAGVALRLNTSTGFPPQSVGTIFVNLNSSISSGIAPVETAPALSTTDWTHLEGVLEIPQGVDAAGLVLFMWKAKGSLYVDDFSFVKVDPTTELTTVVPATTP